MKGLRSFFALTFTLSRALISPTPKLVNVCTGKSCKSGGSLQTIESFRLLRGDDSFEVVADGSCTSNCGKGPNVWVNDGRIYNGVDSDEISLLSAILEIEVGTSESPKILSSLEKYVALLSTSHPPPSSFDGIVEVLKSSKFTYALASILLSRAESYRPTCMDSALEDSLAATSCCPTHPRAYRVLAEIYEDRHNIKGATEALKKHYDIHPELSKSKLLNEIRKLEES